MSSMRLCLITVLVSACTRPQRPDTIYRPRPRGAIDLTVNPDARHCSELTGDFRDAYGLAAEVPHIEAIAVAADVSRVVMRTEHGALLSSEVIGDPDRVRAFWRYDDWTLALVLDHDRCPGNACPAQISLIKYNGAQTPSERPNKLCYERWVGSFERVTRKTTKGSR